MKSVPSALTDALKGDYAVRAVPNVVIDWNLNRYVDVVAQNFPDEQDEGYDIELFPIESIVDVEVPRPAKGINKLRINSGTISSDYFANEGNGRYYINDYDDPYKYWTSPYLSDSAGNITGVQPQIKYGTPVNANKIELKIENCWATPHTFYIQTLNPADTAWTTVADQTSLGSAWKSSGIITLYWSGSAWVTTGRVDDSDGNPVVTSIRGVRIVVTKLEGGYKTQGTLVPTTYRVPQGTSSFEYPTDGGYSHFDLIEIAAHLEADVSAHTIGVGDQADVSEESVLYPIGTLTSNTGFVSLSNIYPNNAEIGLFSKRNTDPSILWTDYLEPNAEVTVKLDYYDEDGNFLGTVPQFVGFTDGWAGQDKENVDVSLSDYSKFFNSRNVRAALWEQLSVPEIVWRILDSSGFTNYQIDRDADKVTEHIIPVFYTTGTDTVWSVLDDLAKASQTAIYFDSQGVLQVKTRDFAFSREDAPVWEFTAVEDGAYLPNIVEIDQDQEYEPNYIKVTYQNTNWSDWNNGQPSLQIVWQPDGDEVLRSSPLVQTIADDTANTFRLGDGIVDYWPFSGKVNIQGEIITFDAKQLVYFTGSTAGTQHTVWVTSEDETKEKTAQTPPGFEYKNFYTGAFRITERGIWNSMPRRHSVDAEGYSIGGRIAGTYHSNGLAGFTFLRNESKIQLASPAGITDTDGWICAYQTSDANFRHYGTQFRFVPNGGEDQLAGLAICLNGAGGYFIEFCPSAKLDAPKLAQRKELKVYSKKTDGAKFDISPIAMRRVAIGENIDYQVDVYHTISGGPSGPQRINVWLNGSSVLNITVPAEAGLPLTGLFGPFIRGRTTAKYEYLYAIARNDIEPPDEFGFLDKVARGYTGDQWDREWVHRWRTQHHRVKKPSRKEKLRWNAQFFDEFGPYVHEVREYDVHFDPSPVLHSKIYSTNDWGSAVLEYSGSPHEAKFIVANTSRNNVVLNGEDSLTFAGTDQSIEQHLYVFGRPLIVEEAEEYVAQNDNQIRRRGRIEAELTSTWLQSKSMAKDVGDWISQHWSYGDSNVKITALGNPLIQVGDVVSVNHPEKHITGDFFVLGVTTNWEDGITSEFSLRRRS